jgi:hypothetical protein
MKSSLSIVVSATVLAALAACGGGGGDSPSQPGSDKVAITSANQNQVVRASVNAGLSVSMAQGRAGGASPASVANRTHALGAVLQRAMTAAQGSRKGIASATVRPSISASDTEPCGVSGTLTVSIDDRDANNALSSGDVISVSFAQCKDSATSSINGAISIALTSTPTATQLTANANFQNVAVVEDGATSTIAGNVAVAENDTDLDTVTTLSVGSGGLTASTASSGYNDSVSFASGFAILTDEATSGASTSVSLSGTMSAQSLGGSITISTPQPLVQLSTDNYPSAGQVIVTGATGSAVRATVLDNTQVRVELDANGDGTYESTSTVAWTTLIV